MKPTPSYDFDIYDIFVPYYSLGPSFSAMSKKRKIHTTVRTQEEQKYQEMPSNVSKLQPLAASSGFCYCSVSASVWTGNWTMC